MREAANPYYNATPAIVQKAMDKFAKVTGRHYNLFDYFGHSAAERIVVIMGSAARLLWKQSNIWQQKTKRSAHCA